MNTTIVLNFIRSANAPQIRAGVMMKNIPWNSMCVSRGIVPGHRILRLSLVRIVRSARRSS